MSDQKKGGKGGKKGGPAASGAPPKTTKKSVDKTKESQPAAAAAGGAGGGGEERNSNVEQPVSVEPKVEGQAAAAATSPAELPTAPTLEGEGQPSASASPEGGAAAPAPAEAQLESGEDEGEGEGSEGEEEEGEPTTTTTTGQEPAGEGGEKPTTGEGGGGLGPEENVPPPPDVMLPAGTGGTLAQTLESYFGTQGHTTQKGPKPLRRPRLQFENSYRLSPKIIFSPEKTKKQIDLTFQEMLAPFYYKQNEAGELAAEIAEKIRGRVMSLNFSRYKLIVLVSIGQSKRQGIHIGFRNLWDPEFDNYAFGEFKNDRVYGIAQVFGIYYD